MSRALGAIYLIVALNARAQTPIILSQPQSVTVNNASAATFAVVATNAASYQWLFNGSSVTGATNATLSLDDLSTNQAGFYSVAITAPGGSITNSLPAQLTVVPGTMVQVTISTYPDGGSSNFTVQLFDHDKPATVANFIHYITSGSYSNTFFDRDVTNFVLQGGDYVTFDRSTNPISGAPVSTGTNIFPSQLDSEFGVGPLIPNHFGTLAMALVSGEPNSATGAFFFNLSDNSSNLDTENGGFTVFGRILSGTNILQYFNTLTAPSNGIYDLQSSVPTLPVNYDGTNFPTDASLFYCDFKLLTTPPVDTSQPTVAIGFPAQNAALTNDSSLTVTGTASDSVTASNNFGLAEVFCVLTTVAGLDAGEIQTNAATGMTNWALNLGTIEPGVYQLTAFAQDGAGHLSAPVTEFFTNLARLTIITNVGGQLTTNVQYLVPGQVYSVTAAPGAGELFDYWQNQGVVSINPVQSFTAETNLTLTVTLVSDNLPVGLAITSPVADSVVQTTNGALTITGTLPSATDVTSVTCQLFARSNAVTAMLPAAINGATWSLTVSNLRGGPYTIVVVAEDSSGQHGLVTENFTARVAPPMII
ncbi:MAG TPA: peptidylprolyl isomerase, partial [Candidatus Cybelea sp.]|nr:peptidylprolyl isomerase [Candidatus Cybelea sp.]